MAVMTLTTKTEADMIALGRLIAAAPGLLETLRDLANAADERFGPDDPYRTIIVQAQAIVAQAQG